MEPSSPFVAFNITCAVIIPFLIWMATTATVDNLHEKISDLEDKLSGVNEELEQAEEAARDAEKKLEDFKTTMRKFID